MRWRASCSSTNIFRECGEPASGRVWLILFPVQMDFRLVSGIGMFRRLVFGIRMSRRLVSGIGIARRLELGSLLLARNNGELYALRVFRAGTRLTVHRPLQV